MVTAARIAAELVEIETRQWREAAKTAKLLGLYSPKTYEGDIANALRQYAGVRIGTTTTFRGVNP